ncbi:hypothetical protein BGW38_010873, partial [Lunasporangiospora selenospora]
MTTLAPSAAATSAMPHPPRLHPSSPPLAPIPSQAAEALLSRARKLSSNAFERHAPHSSPSLGPSAFAEGEDPNRPSTERQPVSDPLDTDVLVTDALSPDHESGLGKVSTESTLIVSDGNTDNTRAQKNGEPSSAQTSGAINTLPSPRMGSISIETAVEDGDISDGEEIHPDAAAATASDVVAPKDGGSDPAEVQSNQDTTNDKSNCDTLTPGMHKISIDCPGAPTVIRATSADGSVSLAPTTATTTMTDSLLDTHVQPSIKYMEATTPTTMPQEERPTPSSLSSEESMSTTTSTITQGRPRALSVESQHQLLLHARPHSVHTSSTVSFTAGIDHERLSATSVGSTTDQLTHHRKHRSEMGPSSGLVLGILEALRANTELDSSIQPFNQAAATTPENTDTAAHLAIHPQDSIRPAHGTPTISIIDSFTITTTIPSRSSSPIITTTPPTAPSPPSSPVVTTPSSATAPSNVLTNKDESPAGSNRTSTDGVSTRPSRKDSIASTASTLSTTPSIRDSRLDNLIHEDSDTSHSSGSGSPKSKSKRASKLFGKLVPKFLHTSFTPATAGGSGGSPRSAQPVSPSPLSGQSAVAPRSSRSASFAGASSAGPMVGLSLSITPTSQKQLRKSMDKMTIQEETVLPGEMVLPTISTTVTETVEDWLTASPASVSTVPTMPVDKDGVPMAMPPISRRMSSFSSNLSAVCEDTKSVQSTFEAEFEAEFSQLPKDEENDREDQNNTTANVSSPPSSTKTKVNDTLPGSETQAAAEAAQNYWLSATSSVAAAGGIEPPSPYIIDENCDDEFFLNSVLNKTKRASSPPISGGHSASGSSRSSFSSGHPLSHPIAGSPVMTPPLTLSIATSTTSVNSVSGASPTSPYGNGIHQGAFTTTPSSAYPSSSYSNSGQYFLNHPAYHSPMQHPGLDEKRTRLRDAVGEWR